MKTKILMTCSQFLFIFSFLFGMNLSTAAPQISNQSTDCKPYSIPLDPVACGPGYTGVKFPLKVKSCPSGVITVGQTFNTENCKRVGDNIDPNQTNCAITPTDISCVSKPAPLGCPPGQHWVTTGSGIAHCVQNDFPCPWGQSLQHDPLGNPYCVPNTCPSNQVLQADGISCACPAGLVWDGGLCVAACSPTTSIETQSCDAGYTGTKSRTVTATCPLGTPSYSAWDTSSCVPNTVTCPADEYTATSCTSGSGTAYRWYSYIGASCTRTYMGLDESGCTSTPPSCPSDTVFSSSCGAGYSGMETTTTTYVGASCTPSTTTDRSACIPVGPSSCPADVVTYLSCSAGYSGSKTQTTTYTGASCTPSTSVVDNCVKDPVLCPAPTTVVESCPAGWTGSKTTTTTYSGPSCSANVSVVENCVFMPPADVFTEVLFDFWSNSPGNPGESCSFQVWLLKYKNGIKYAEEMVSFNPGFVDASGTCILY